MEHNTHGGGSNTTKNGKTFEEKQDIRKTLEKNGYTVSDEGIVSKSGQHVGIFVKQQGIYN